MLLSSNTSVWPCDLCRVSDRQVWVWLWARLPVWGRRLLWSWDRSLQVSARDVRSDVRWTLSWRPVWSRLCPDVPLSWPFYRPVWRRHRAVLLLAGIHRWFVPAPWVSHSYALFSASHSTCNDINYATKIVQFCRYNDRLAAFAALCNSNSKQSCEIYYNVLSVYFFLFQLLLSHCVGTFCHSVCFLVTVALLRNFVSFFCFFVTDFHACAVGLFISPDEQINEWIFMKFFFE